MSNALEPTRANSSSFSTFSGVGGRINGWGNRLDLCAQLLLDAVQVEAVIVCDKIDTQAQVTKAARAANAVQVGLGVLGEIEIDHHVHTSECQCLW